MKHCMAKNATSVTLYVTGFQKSSAQKKNGKVF